MQKLELTHFTACSCCKSYKAILQNPDESAWLQVSLNRRELEFVCRSPLDLEAPPPPLVYTLRALIAQQGLRLTRIVYGRREDGRLIASLYAEASPAGNEESLMELPPGEGIALAVHLSVPLFATPEALLERGFTADGPSVPASTLPAREQVRAWIDAVRPEEFGRAS